ncbi:MULTISPECIES: hypothetical protein [unclassified Sphingobacterium]|uniref:hypothetical protein n=1 Tax=unclassified Sphingobacterium TaxID=2609468 RepID=UPI0010E97FB2|nr:MULTISPECIES: hypothetical protein [unclassified Sphingobacterium]MCS3556141.1 hypothetical protein [Sphingobacterium sp. JUb21]TCR08517.1 hypothetical protein EDF66_10364 [Sphingobacterium sp. JUb20]
MKKKNYIQPRIEAEVIEIEYSIAAGSAAQTSTQSESGSIGESWQVEDSSRSIDW